MLLEVQHIALDMGADGVNMDFLAMLGHFGLELQELEQKRQCLWLLWRQSLYRPTAKEKKENIFF